MLRERRDVAAGHEMAPAAAQYDHAKRIVVGDRRRMRDQHIHHREVERVERGGTIQRQRCDAADALEEDRIGHRRAYLPASRNGLDSSSSSTAWATSTRS